MPVAENANIAQKRGPRPGTRQKRKVLRGVERQMLPEIALVDLISRKDTNGRWVWVKSHEGWEKLWADYNTYPTIKRSWCWASPLHKMMGAPAPGDFRTGQIPHTQKS